MTRNRRAWRDARKSMWRRQHVNVLLTSLDGRASRSRPRDSLEKSEDRCHQSNNWRAGVRFRSRSRMRPPIARRRTISRPSRRCSARFSSTMTRSTASRTSWSPSISPRRCTAASMTSRAQLIRAGKLATVDHAEDVPGRHRSRRRDRFGTISRDSPPRRRRSSTPRTTAAPFYDLAMRRELITIGEDMVNVAYDSPIDAPPRAQIEDAERQLYSNSPKRAATTAASSASPKRSPRRIDMASERLSSATAISPAIATGLLDLDARWAACKAPTSSSSPAVPAWARPRSPPTSPSTSPRPINRRTPSPTARIKTDRWRDRRLLLARNVGRAAGDPHHRRAVRRRVLQDPPRRHQRGRFRAHRRRRTRDAEHSLLHRPDRRHLDRAAHRARAGASSARRASTSS